MNNYSESFDDQTRGGSSEPPLHLRADAIHELFNWRPGTYYHNAPTILAEQMYREPVVASENASNIGVELVIASHTETLKWVDMWKCFNATVNQIPCCKVTIYRTGDHADGCIHIENQAREASQWMHHIVENYDNLSDFTFFLQADLGASFGVSGHDWPQDLNVFKRLKLPDNGVDDNSFYCWPSLDRIVPFQAMDTQNKVFGPSDTYEDTPSEANRFWGRAPDKIRWPCGGFFYGAQFGVTRNFVRRFPKSYYENAMSIIRTGSVNGRDVASWLEFAELDIPKNPGGLLKGGWPTIIFDVFNQRNLTSC